jgi:hypothetical protein
VLPKSASCARSRIVWRKRVGILALLVKALGGSTWTVAIGPCLGYTKGETSYSRDREAM